jgi:hypothetical protein
MYKQAPAGFTLAQWEVFQRDGILLIEDAISAEDIATYTEAIDRVTHADPAYQEGEYYGIENIVERDPLLAGLIDHPRHVGFAYDIYGELLKLHQSQLFLRTPQEGHNNQWHPDGARALPYHVFSPRLPLQIKIGYWLTDLPEEQMGNLVVLKGSHREQYMDAYDTHEAVDGQFVLTIKAGTMSIMHSSIWHQVQANNSQVTRKNFFLAYCPAWLTPADRLSSDPEWLANLTREQRIIMRSYDHAYHNAKPPASEFPLYVDRDSQEDHDPGMYREHVQRHRRKRITTAEKFEQQLSHVGV